MCSEGTGTAGTSGGFSRAPHTPRGQSPRLPGPSVGCPELSATGQHNPRGLSAHKTWNVDPLRWTLSWDRHKDRAEGTSPTRTRLTLGGQACSPVRPGSQPRITGGSQRKQACRGPGKSKELSPGDHESGQLNLNPPLDGAQTWVGGGHTARRNSS